MRLLNEGPEARAEMAQFFTTLKNEKTSFINALQKIAALHWDVNNAAVKTKRWFNLAKLMHESDGEKTNPRTHNRPDDKSIGSLKPQPASSLLGSASKQPSTPRDASSRVGDVKSTHGQKPMTTPPLKWTDPSSKSGLCQVCNIPHLDNKPNCRFLLLDKALGNHEKKPWKESAIGKSYASTGYYSAMDKPPAWHLEQITQGRTLPDTPKGENINNISLKNEDESFTAKLTVTIAQADERDSASSIVSCLLDTGAGANFISSNLINRYKLKSHKLKDLKTYNRNNIEVCGATDANCINITNYIRLKIEIYTKLIKKTINVLCFVGPFKEDLIIGLRDIRRHNLILASPKAFFSNQLDSTDTSSIDEALPTGNDDSTRGLQECVEEISALKRAREASTLPTSQFLCCDTQCMCGE